MHLTHALRSASVLLAVIGAVQSFGAEHSADCVWYSDGGEIGRFERRMLADGYLRVHMHDESLDVLEALAAEDLTRDERASVHRLFGVVYYRTKSLEKALFHYQQAVASRRFPECWMPGLWRALAGIAFEMGRFKEAAEYAENWRATNETVHPKYRNVLALTPEEVLRVAEYWSHVERERALAYVDTALQDAEHDFDAATLAWIQRLRKGEAPAEIPPRKRPWLDKPPLSLREEEVMRKVKVWREYRKRVTRPAEHPQALPREEWVVEDRHWTTLDAIMLPPSTDDVAAVITAPVLPPPEVRHEEAEQDDLDTARQDVD